MIDYREDFRNSRYAEKLVAEIKQIPLEGEINLMEICGGHTIAIFRYGIRELLPAYVKLLSGPGCPVCVTDNEFIDKAIDLCRRDDVIIATFGDMLKVPGSTSSLARERAAGHQVRVCLAATDAVQLARSHPQKKVVFLGIGFETTAPTIAAALKLAKAERLENFFVLSAMKTMPAALEALCGTEEFNVQGFICPGHVSAITGTGIYQSVAAKHGLPCVVAGFEPLDLLQTILMLLRQIAAGRADIEIQYSRCVSPAGNPVARRIMQEVLEPADSAWRGLGVIPGSGLRLRETYSEFDADRQFRFTLPQVPQASGCICGAIMRGVRTPLDCKLFAGVCSPLDPRGACMVSAEGTCATYYKYQRGKK